MRLGYPSSLATHLSHSLPAITPSTPPVNHYHPSPLHSTPHPPRRVLSGQCTCPVTRWLRQRGVSESHGWRLVLTGHSLGGAVAALLAAALRPRYPSLRCWAVAPPGGTADPATAASWSLFVTTVVVGKDLVPRMSLWSLEQMQSRMVELLARSRLGKTGVFLAYMRGYLLDPERAFMPMEEVPEVTDRWEFVDMSRVNGAFMPMPMEEVPQVCGGERDE